MQIAAKFTTEEAGLRWLTTYLRNKCCLVKGEDVMQYLGKPGPEVGKVLGAAWKAQMEGMFVDRDGAIGWLEERMQEEDRAESTLYG